MTSFRSALIGMLAFATTAVLIMGQFALMNAAVAG